VVRDRPSGLWVFGAVFVTSGLIVLTIPFLSSAWNGFVLWERAAVIAIGHVVRRAFSRQREITEFKMSDARGVEIRTTQDSDGDPMYQLRLWLSGSRVLALQGQPAHDRARVEKVAASFRQALALPENGIAK